MNRSATVTVSALGTIHARFNRKEDAGIDSFLNLSCKVNETVEIVARPERVELMVSRRFGLGVHVEAEQGIDTVFLLKRITERCRLKITVDFSLRPVR
jgi:hypothetical protein